MMNEPVKNKFGKIISLIGICSGCIVMGLIFTMVNTAIPTIQKNLGIPTHNMQWTMMSFGIVNCAMLVTSGRLADIFGRKKIFLIGLFSSGIGMLLGGFSHGSLGLIFSMILAGLGNAILLPVSQAILVAEFPETQKSRAIALWISVIAYAMSMGPLIGGLISQIFGWHWVFWSTVPMAAISFIFVSLFSKESKNMEDPPVIDYKGMLLIGIGLSSFVLVITEFKTFPLIVIIPLFLLACLSLFLLWKNSATFPAPILLIELIRKRAFMAASIASACLVFYLWSIFFLLPLYLQNVRHLSSLVVGSIMLAITIPVILFSPIIGKKYHQNLAWSFISIGFIFLFMSSIFQIFFHENSSLLFIIMATLLFGIGNSLISGPTATAAISMVSKHKAGIASGTFITFQEIGGTLGLSLVVTYVGLYSDLAIGFQKGVFILLFISVIGGCCGLMLNQTLLKKLQT